MTKDGAIPESSGNGKPVLHPVYSVTNILLKVRMLDSVKITYSSWVKLFSLHAKGYKVSHHIDGTRPPAKTDPTYAEWCEIDAHVLQWIYGSISEDLLIRIFETESTAHEAWLRLKNHFQNNKGARAAALEHEFTNMSLVKCSSLDEYCQKLKDIGSQLTDVGSTVDDQRLVLQMVHGLPKEYDTVGAYINQTLPTFENARGMLQLEEHMQQRPDSAPATALVAPAAPPPTQSNWGDGSASGSINSSYRNNNTGQKKSNYKGKGKGGGWNNNQRGGGNSGGGRGAPQQTWVAAGPPQMWPMQWSIPPCPYPTQQGWLNPWQPTLRGMQQQQQVRFQTFQLPGQPYIASDALEPTQMGQAFQAMTLYQPEDNSFYMDTGASSHLTSDSGMLSPPFHKSSIKSIYVGNGKSIPVHGSGNATITTPTREFAFKNLLYTP
ncbi:uncharacterized protein LOC141655071 [Silene latifolia]|uniref:uncharacterized protein LOC141655071 n=1 Tax=Silene latifolia TaxID=37657 RepID=UPI003D77A05A